MSDYVIKFSDGSYYDAPEDDWHARQCRAKRFDSKESAQATATLEHMRDVRILRLVPPKPVGWIVEENEGGLTRFFLREEAARTWAESNDVVFPVYKKAVRK